jgi:hypothetical protein
MRSKPSKSDMSPAVDSAAPCVSGSGACNSGTALAGGRNANAPEFEQIVDDHYAALYRFGLSLARSGSAAADLTQQTFYPR